MKDIDARLEVSNRNILIEHDGADRVSNEIRNIVLYSQGDIIMDFDAGDIVSSFLLDDIDDDGAFALRNIIRQNIIRNTDSKEVSDVRVFVEKDEFEGKYDVSVYYNYQGVSSKVVI